MGSESDPCPPLLRSVGILPEWSAWLRLASPQPSRASSPMPCLCHTGCQPWLILPMPLPPAKPSNQKLIETTRTTNCSLRGHHSQRRWLQLWKVCGKPGGLLRDAKAVNILEETIVVLQTGPICSIRKKNGGRKKEHLKTLFLHIKRSLSLSSAPTHCFRVL